MKRLISLLFSCGLLITTICFSQGTWVQKANLGGSKRYGAIGFSIGSKGYFGTGISSAYFHDLWEWDQSTDTWTQKANFPDTSRAYAIGFSIANKGYVGTGYNWNVGGIRKDFWEYDPALNTWMQKANLPGIARCGAAVFTIGSKAFVGTGQDGNNNCLTDFWEYNSTSNTWSSVAVFPSARAFAVGFSIGNKGYVGTGSTTNVAFNDLWEFDPTTNSWMQKANLPSIKRDDAIGFAIGNYGYIGLGDSLNFQTYKFLALSDFWQYSAVTNSWTQMANYGGGIASRPTGFVIGCKGYVGTGWSGPSNFGGAKNDFWEFTPPFPSSISNITNVNCFGNNTGSALVNVSGGTPSYSYLWNSIPTQTTQSATGLYAGTYFITVTDSVGCTLTDTVTIASPTGLTALPPATTNLNCFGTSNGTATISPAGGTPAYTYAWNPTGQTNSSATGLAAGIYTITITDNNGCIINTLAQITQPTAIVASISSDTSICFGTTAMNNVTATGGTPGYNYLWASGGETTASITVSPSANTTYTAQITDANGCSAQAAITTVSVVPNPAPYISYTADLCTGSVQFTDSSANTNTWVWNFGDGGTSAVQQPAHSYLMEGSYSVTVTLSGSLGCKTVYLLLADVPAFSQLYIPNAFSPNDDDNNDFYYISGKCITQMTFSIYNRWGEKIFETTDQTIGWDGTYKGEKQNAGAYMYSFSGTLTTNEKINKKGNITLMK